MCFRKAGYVVDIEERRGKDEQRVDEQLHFAIYKVRTFDLCKPFESQKKIIRAMYKNFSLMIFL